MAIKYRTGGAASLSPIKLIKIQCEANMFVVHIREIVFFSGICSIRKEIKLPRTVLQLNARGKIPSLNAKKLKISS